MCRTGMELHVSTQTQKTRDRLGPESRALSAIDLLLRSVPGARTKALPLAELLRREADALVSAHRAGEPAAAYLIRGEKYRPGTSQATDAETLTAELTYEQALACIVRWHWFSDWSEVTPHAQKAVDPRFEAACDAIVDGRAKDLRALLGHDPSLVHARSRFGHHQTLIQHVAANGIEKSRQWQSPSNAVEIAEILLSAGSEPDATCDSYGGSTAMTLLVTSAHPAAAGVQADLVDALCKGGAMPDGIEDDGRPLWLAISSCYTAAVDALVRCGARIDNLLFAAAAGDLIAVASYFDEAGRPLPGRAYGWGGALALAKFGRQESKLEAMHTPEYALHWAIAHRRRRVVELLLTKTLDFSVREPTWNSTVLGMAEYAGDPHILAIVRSVLDKTGRP